MLNLSNSQTRFARSRLEQYCAASQCTQYTFTEVKLHYPANAISRSFSYHRQRIVLQIGFSEQNVRALCDIGNSTKQHHTGYIGQKGIGFKSVFKVTDAAEIHSRGFHISFDLLQHETLGYILPTWIGATASSAPETRLSSLQSAATRVVLPYKQVFAQHRTCKLDALCSCSSDCFCLMLSVA